MSKKITLTKRDVTPILEVRRDTTTPRVGAEARQHRWRQVRTLVAQTLLSNPSILLYMKQLGVRKIRTQVMHLHGLLCKLISDIQEITDFTPAPKTPDTNTLQEVVEKNLAGTASIEEVRAELVSVLSRASKNHVRAKRVTSGATQESVSALLKECAERLATVRASVFRILGTEILSGNLNLLVQESVLQSIHQYAREEDSADRTVALAASLGSLDFSMRATSLRHVIDQEKSLPVKFSSKTRGNVLTLSVDPSLLPLRVGDEISVAGVTAVVLSVSGKTLTLSQSVPASSISMQNPYHTQFQQSERLLREIIAIRGDVLLRGFRPENRPDAVRTCTAIVELATAFEQLTRDASAAAGALSINTPESPGILRRLSALRPTFDQAIREQGDGILRLLRSEGFSAAEEYLSYGSYDMLLTADPQMAASLSAQADQTLLGVVTEVIA
jgi:hypothetical protein